MTDKVNIPFEDFIKDPSGSFARATAEHKLTVEEFVGDTANAFTKAGEGPVLITETVNGEEKQYVLRRVKIAKQE